MLNFFKRKLGIIEKFRSKNESLIQFEQLKDIPISTPTEVIPERLGAILITRIPCNISNDILLFRVEMKKDEVWSPHVYDCWERIIFHQGHCVDTISGKEAMKGKQMIIKPNTLRRIKCLSDEAVFYVEFNKKLF